MFEFLFESTLSVSLTTQFCIWEALLSEELSFLENFPNIPVT